MAASVILGRNGAKHFPSSLWKTTIRHASGVYYVLLPEVPPDTAETNALMRYKSYPEFSKITPDDCVTGPAKLAIQYETKLGNLIEKLKDPKDEKTFEGVFEPIERATVPMGYAWSTAKQLYGVKRTTDFKRAFLRIHSQVTRAKDERWQSETMYNAVKEVAANRSNLNEYQQRLADMYLLEGRLHGIELGPKRKLFNELSKMIVDQCTHFRNNVNVCGRIYSNKIEDFDLIQSLPRSLLQKMAADRANPSRGPWTVTLEPDIYFNFLSHCSDRPLRYNAWLAYNTRCDVSFNSRNLANKKLLEDILLHRRDVAKMLGYENYAEVSMESKMAGSIENVLTMIQTYKSKIAPRMEEDLAQLQQFAMSEGFLGKLEMWDISYWRKRQCNHLYNIDETQVAEYFPFETVLEKLFAFCNQLFGITIKESEQQVDVWTDNVRFYSVYDENGAEISTFYLDPYRRAEKAEISRMDTGRDRSDIVGVKPFCYLSLNLNPPLTKSTPVLMSFHDVLKLFKEMGNGLQQMLTKVPYCEISGQRYMELDAVDICSSFMKRWCLQPQFLQSISSHVQTDQPMPMEMVEALINSRNHFFSYDVSRLLYFSALDMEFHVSKDHWFDIMGRVWKEFMPLPLNDQDVHPYSFTPVISEMYHSAFYSFIWTEMIAADVFEAFKEIGEKPDKMKDIGTRFRDTFLSLGSGVPAGEVFRRFRGRDPSLDAYLTEYGISTD